MQILAPLVLTLGASYLLYGQVELWKLSVYELEVKGAPKLVAQDAIKLKEGVKAKQINPAQAEHLFESKYGPGASNKLQVIDEHSAR